MKNYSKEVTCNNVYQLDIVRAFPTYMEKIKHIKLPEDKSEYKIEIGNLLRNNTKLREEIITYIYNTFIDLLKYNGMSEKDILRFYVDEIIIPKPIVKNEGECVIDFGIFKIKQKRLKKYIYSKLINSGFVKIYYDDTLKIDGKTLLPYANDLILDLYNSINKRLVITNYISGLYKKENYITNYKKNNVILFKNNVYIDPKVYKHEIDKSLLDKKLYYNIAKIYNFLISQ